MLFTLIIDDFNIRERFHNVGLLLCDKQSEKMEVNGASKRKIFKKPSTQKADLISEYIVDRGLGRSRMAEFQKEAQGKGLLVLLPREV